ncbi:unnamed protein product, partial [Brugia timori]|uniref:Reverse transcriptase domain-containing protein n=1 Tax=Brugia timori TaxID=42155 RepID=A0A0R3QCW6_9BILA
MTIVNAKKPIYDVEGNKIQISEKLTENEYELAKRKLQPYIPMFTQEPEQIEVARVSGQVLELIDFEPTKRRNFQLAYRERIELIKLLKALEKAGVIKKQKSRYESPVFLKKKPDGSYRLLVDYRAVNKKVKKDNNRVPNIDSIWPHMRDMKYFTSLDLNSGYFQIPITEESKELTGINVDGQGYVFNSIPQGMTCSPSIFQTIMMEIFEKILWEKVVCYLDDICVYGKNFNECVNNTIEVLNILNNKEVDASAYAIGAILCQLNPKTKEKFIIGYFSEKLSDDKKHLCSFDLEMLAVTRACQFFRYYLLGHKFIIYTDHQPLIFQNRFLIPSPRLSRLLSKLCEFNFEIKHIAGKNN